MSSILAKIDDIKKENKNYKNMMNRLQNKICDLNNMEGHSTYRKELFTDRN